MKKQLRTYALLIAGAIGVASGSARADLLGHSDPILDNLFRFPTWYQDRDVAHGGLQLELCLPADTYCARPFANPFVPNPALPNDGLNFPNNFPVEVFYSLADSQVFNLTGAAAGGSVRIVLDLTASFINLTHAVDGDQMVFSRLRFRGFSLPAGTYRFTHPYGQDVIDTGPAAGKKATRDINTTTDIGLVPISALGTAAFDISLNSRFGGAPGAHAGSWLTWSHNPAEQAAPQGYIGNPLVPHTITGSPFCDVHGNCQNFVLVEKLNVRTNLFEQVGLQTQFLIAGKIHGVPHTTVPNPVPLPPPGGGGGGGGGKGGKG